MKTAFLIGPMSGIDGWNEIEFRLAASALLHEANSNDKVLGIHVFQESLVPISTPISLMETQLINKSVHLMATVDVVITLIDWQECPLARKLKSIADILEKDVKDIVKIFPEKATKSLS